MLGWSSQKDDEFKTIIIITKITSESSFSSE